MTRPPLFPPSPGWHATQRILLKIDGRISRLRTNAVLHDKWWRPAWQSGYNRGLADAHAVVVHETEAAGFWSVGAAEKQFLPARTGDAA